MPQVEGTADLATTSRPPVRLRTPITARREPVNTTMARKTEQARETLEKEGLIQAGGATTPAALAKALTQITHNIQRIPKQATEAITAVATLLDDLHSNEIISNVSDQITKALTPSIEQLAANATALEEFRRETHAILDLMNSTTLDLSEKIELATNSANQPMQSPPTPQTTPATYAAALQSIQSQSQPLPPRHAEVITRSQGRTRQILIERPPPTTNEGNPPEQAETVLTEKELVAKANLAVKMMGIAGTDRPSGDNPFVGALRLRRGGVLYTMASDEAVNWIKMNDVKKAFEEQYGGMFAIKERGYPVIVEFVPVTFNPSSPQTLRNLEIDNGLHTGTITEAKYLKQVERRHQGQTTAFAMLTLSNPQTANSIIREGIIIEGKKVYGRKDRQEPKRCMKCQKFRPTHRAATCAQIHDTCPKCGKMHRASECKEEIKFCANCRAPGHTASDRKCQVFQQELKRIGDWHPENNYRYFPVSDDPTTWEPLGSDVQRTEGPPGQGFIQASNLIDAIQRAELRLNEHRDDRARRERGQRPTRGRAAQFNPPPQDNGWTQVNRTQRSSEPSNANSQQPHSEGNQTQGRQNLTQNAASGASQTQRRHTQTRIDNYLPSRNPNATAHNASQLPHA
jgi:hypothetical protein